MKMKFLFGAASIAAIWNCVGADDNWNSYIKDRFSAVGSNCIKDNNGKTLTLQDGTTSLKESFENAYALTQMGITAALNGKSLEEIGGQTEIEDGGQQLGWLVFNTAYNVAKGKKKIEFESCLNCLKFDKKAEHFNEDAKIYFKNFGLLEYINSYANPKKDLQKDRPVDFNVWDNNDKTVIEGKANNRSEELKKEYDNFKKKFVTTTSAGGGAGSFPPPPPPKQTGGMPKQRQTDGGASWLDGIKSFQFKNKPDNSSPKPTDEKQSEQKEFSKKQNEINQLNEMLQERDAKIRKLNLDLEENKIEIEMLKQAMKGKDIGITELELGFQVMSNKMKELKQAREKDDEKRRENLIKALHTEYETGLEVLENFKTLCDNLRNDTEKIININADSEEDLKAAISKFITQGLVEQVEGFSAKLKSDNQWDVPDFWFDVNEGKKTAELRLGKNKDKRGGFISVFCEVINSFYSTFCAPQSRQVGVKGNMFKLNDKNGDLILPTTHATAKEAQTAIKNIVPYLEKLLPLIEGKVEQIKKEYHANMAGISDLTSKAGLISREGEIEKLKSKLAAAIKGRDVITVELDVLKKRFEDEISKLRKKKARETENNLTDEQIKQILECSCYQCIFSTFKEFKTTGNYGFNFDYTVPEKIANDCIAALYASTTVNASTLNELKNIIEKCIKDKLTAIYEQSKATNTILTSESLNDNFRKEKFEEIIKEQLKAKGMEIINGDSGNSGDCGSQQSRGFLGGIKNGAANLRKVNSNTSDGTSEKTKSNGESGWGKILENDLKERRKNIEGDNEESSEDDDGSNKGYWDD